MRAAFVAVVVLLGSEVFSTALDGRERSRTPDEPAIWFEARALEPGEVVLATIRFSTPPDHVRSTLFGREVLFVPRADLSTWQALIGIDLAAKPGVYAMTVVAGRSSEVKRTYDFIVEPRAFGTRRITVSPEYVTPPEEVRPRIVRESRVLGAIYRTVRPESFWRDDFRSAVPGAAVSGFGLRSILNGQVRNPHSGADLRAPEGTTVLAPASARVVLATSLYYTGNTVIFDHGLGLYSLLAHLSEMDVVEGEHVSARRIVGRVGATGRVTGPHLHWAVRVHGARVDPEGLLAIRHSEDGGYLTADLRRIPGIARGELTRFPLGVRADQQGSRH